VPRALTDEDYARLLAFRTRLRAFERWSQERAGELGLTSAQHQLLLAIRGHHDRRGPTISEVAQYLLVRHHTVVELADRAQAAGLIERSPDAHDQRSVRLGLTSRAAQVLDELSAAHLEELARVAPVLGAVLEPEPLDT